MNIFCSLQNTFHQNAGVSITAENSMFCLQREYILFFKEHTPRKRFCLHQCFFEFPHGNAYINTHSMSKEMLPRVMAVDPFGAQSFFTGRLSVAGLSLSFSLSRSLSRFLSFVHLLLCQNACCLSVFLLISLVVYMYGMASISRLLRIIGLFCKRAL